MRSVATTSVPAVARPNADRWMPHACAKSSPLDRVKYKVSVEFEFEMGFEVAMIVRSHEIDTKLYSSWSLGSSWSFTTFPFRWVVIN